MKKLVRTRDPLFTWALHPNQLYEYGRSIGISSEKILINTGLDHRDTFDINLHISWDQYREISMNFERDGPKDWCFQFAKRLSIASHGLFSLLALNCTNWRQAIEDVQTYSLLINPIFFVKLRETDKHIYIVVDSEFSRDQVIRKHVEGYFTTLYQGIFQMGATDLAAIRNGISVYINAPKPCYSSALDSFFGGTIHWDCYVDHMRVDKDLIARNIPNANPISAAHTRKLLQAQLSQLPAQNGIIRELNELFSQGVFSLEECAKRLYTSTPTLKRFLKEAKTTFSYELSRYRIQEALWFSKHSDISVSEVSEKLGFQDVNSFSRLFKKHTLLSFSQFKEQAKKTI